MKKILTIIMILLIVSGCNQKPPTINSQNQNVEEVVVGANSPFKMLLPATTSPIRGITVKSDTYFSLNNMEDLLLDISADYISNDLYFSQGNVLTGDDASNLLNTKLSDEEFAQLVQSDPDAQNIGLNSSDYNLVTTLIEHDFYEGKGDKKEIKAISIGVGLDTTKYSKDADGNIDMERLLNHDGKIIANQIAQVIRAKAGYETIPICFGFYNQSSNSVVPGVYIAKGEIKSDDENIQSLDSVNQEYVLFLNESGSQKDLDLNNKIQTLKNDLNSYFGDNVSVNCLGFYQNNKLKNIDIEIVYDSSSNVEGNAMINFIDNEVNSRLNIDHDYLISVVSPTGSPIACIMKNGGSVNKVVYKE